MGGWTDGRKYGWMVRCVFVGMHVYFCLYACTYVPLCVNVSFQFCLVYLPGSMVEFVGVVVVDARVPFLKYNAVEPVVLHPIYV